MARSELDRVRARSFDVDASVVKARQTVETARVELARGMGLTVTDLDAAPLRGRPASDRRGRSTASRGSPSRSSWTALPIKRADVKAAHAKVVAADALLAGARST